MGPVPRKTNLPASKEKRAITILRRSGLRPTRQLIGLTVLLFGYRDRHVSAEDLFSEAGRKGIGASLSSVYRSLRRFHEAGLIRKVPIYGAVAYYDTNLDEHHHFHVEDDDLLIDVPDGEVSLGRLPDPPAGYELIGAEIVLRLKRTPALALENAGA